MWEAALAQDVNNIVEDLLGKLFSSNSLAIFLGLTTSEVFRNSDKKKKIYYLLDFREIILLKFRLDFINIPIPKLVFLFAKLIINKIYQLI